MELRRTPESLGPPVALAPDAERHRDESRQAMIRRTVNRTRESRMAGAS